MTYLDEILAVRRVSVGRRKVMQPLTSVRCAAHSRLERRDFAGALRSGALAVIAEFKRASPSAGSIDAAADPALVAAAYERGGAAALSVLTEPDKFHGSFDDLRAARAATSLPVLCKDFIFDEYQVWEAAAAGADAVLLIAAMLDNAMLRMLVALALTLRIAPLVEVHDEDEIGRAVAAGTSLIGINNRDLYSFVVDATRATRLRPHIPSGIVVVAESGYKTAADIAPCAAAGIDAVLVGEALMRGADKEAAVCALRGIAR